MQNLTLVSKLSENFQIKLSNCRERKQMKSETETSEDTKRYYHFKISQFPLRHNIPEYLIYIRKAKKENVHAKETIKIK